MPLFANTHIDFGYPWWLSYGHLPLLVTTVALLFFGYRRKWPRLLLLSLGVLAVWSGAAFGVARFALPVHGRGVLPTENFLQSGAGRVLDIGAGTGRSSIMVLEARPAATVVALDLFAESFERHFGAEGTPQQRLLANLQAAGVDDRATIQAGDMLQLPFGANEFDAVVSAYAIDHVGRQGAERALSEAARVVKPGGDFLLLVVANDSWAQFAFGPLLMHGGPRGAEWWTEQVRSAGFEVVEQGTQPATIYVLARRE